MCSVKEGFCLRLATMSVKRPLVLAVAPLLLGGLAACGSSSSAPTTPSVHDAAVAFQNALINDDPAGACKYVDAAALQAQIAKSPQLKGKDCVTLLTTVLTLAKSTNQSIQPAKDITVLSESGDNATVKVTSAAGKAETSTWKLEGGVWKVTATVASN
jgi:hypothetical protein